MNGEKGVKRTFSELRNRILLALADGQKTTNQISIKSGINWRTVESHLTYLLGKGLVREVLKSEYVRIFRLTDDGELYVKELFSQKIKVINGAKVIVNGEVVE